MEISQIKETCLYVKDLSETADFYYGKLKFPVISMVEESHVFFRVGSSVLLCFLPEIAKTKTSPPPHYAYGHQHIAFEVNAEQYKQWKERIMELGIPIIQEQKWKNDLQSFYFLDPDKHVLEIIPHGIWE